MSIPGCPDLPPDEHQYPTITVAGQSTATWTEDKSLSPFTAKASHKSRGRPPTRKRPQVRANGTGLYVCPKCGFQLKSQDSFRKHFDRQHCVDGTEMTKCSFCSKLFKKNNKSRHLQSKKCQKIRQSK